MVRQLTIALTALVLFVGARVDIYTDTRTSDPSCAAGTPSIWYRSDTTVWKKCENGAISNLDTGGGGGTTVSIDGVSVGAAINFDDGGDINFTNDGDGTASTAIKADAVALTTDTTGNYVKDVADGTGIDGTASGEGTTYTPTLDLTEATCTAPISCPSAAAITTSMATSRLVGRTTASTGVMEEITVAAPLTLSALTLDVTAIADADLASSYSGVGSCTNQFVRAVNDNAAPTCNDVTLSTDTAGSYVQQVADGTGIDGTANTEGATYTPTLDLTEISSATFGAGAFTTLTFDAGATDPVFTMSSAATATMSGGGTSPVLALDDAGAVRWLEEDAGGANYKAFVAPATLTADTTCTFEDDANFIPDSCVGDGTDATGGGNSVEVTLDFTTGAEVASVVVTGQAWVAAGSEIVCAPTMMATADRAEGAEDPVIEGLVVAAHSRVVGTGFTLTGAPRFGNAYGKFIIHCIGV